VYELDLRRYIHERINVDVADDVHTDDVLQEVRVAVYMHSVGGKVLPASFRPWVRKIARCKLADATRDARELKHGGQVDHARHRRRRASADALSRAICPRRTTEQDALYHELLTRLRAARARLSAPDRQALQLHYDDELTYEVMGRRLRKTIRQVERLLRHALRALRSSLVDAKAGAPKPPSAPSHSATRAENNARKP
jgi:RNA polymerase sigma factor (sigma-70 family)